jgi:heme exporter protein C
MTPSPSVNPERPSWSQRAITGVGFALLPLVLLALVLVFHPSLTPAYVIGETVLPCDVCRIFYFHVPMAFMAYVAFFVVFLASILYLWQRQKRWDRLARSSAELGVVFTSLVLLTGSLWAKPIWGTWWTWDARLTTTLILWFIYVTYLMLRAYAGDEERAARYAAVLGIIGFADVPLIHFSVTLWRTLHPPNLAQLGGDLELPGAMLFVLLYSLAVVALLYVYLLFQRLWLAEATDELRALRQSVMNRPQTALRGPHA